MSTQRVFLLALALFFGLAAAQPGLAGTRDLSQYPLQFHMYTHDHAGNSHRGFRGHGKANIIAGNEVRGAEFAYSCMSHLYKNKDADESYPAKWKKPGLKLEILVGVIGSDTATRTCEMNISLKDKVYVKDHSNVVEVSQEEYAARINDRWNQRTALAPWDGDPAHYPLQLAILHLRWDNAKTAMQTGGGEGNLVIEGGQQAVDFSIGCPVRIELLPEGRYYAARWRQEGSQMTLLLESPGGGPTAVCELATTLHPDMYVRQANGTLKAVPPAAASQ